MEQREQAAPKAGNIYVFDGRPFLFSRAGNHLPWGMYALDHPMFAKTCVQKEFIDAQFKFRTIDEAARFLEAAGAVLIHKGRIR